MFLNQTDDQTFEELSGIAVQFSKHSQHFYTKREFHLTDCILSKRWFELWDSDRLK